MSPAQPPNRPEYRYTSREEVTLEDFSGSLNQAAPPDKVPVTDFLRFLNARVSEDGKTIERRPGVTKLYAFTGKRILGAYGINEIDETKLLVCLNDDIQLKTGGVWSSIFTPTRQATSPVKIAQYKGLTFISGYEKPIMVRNGQGFYPGLDAPTTPPIATAVGSGSEILADSYDETNTDHLGELRQSTTRALLAQSFKAGKTLDLAKVNLKIRKVGSPTGNLWVEIHSSQAGTSATKNASTNIVGQGSANVALTGITSSFATVEFNFTGTKPSLTTGTTYFIVLYGDFSVSSSAFAEAGFDSGDPEYADGKYYEISSSFAWVGNESVDLVFEAWGPTGPTETLLAFGYDITGYDYNLRDQTSHTFLAQSFKLSDSATVEQILLPLKKTIDEFLDGPVGKIWVEVHSSATTGIRVQAEGGDKTIEVDDTTGMVAGQDISIVLNDSIHWDTIASVTDGDTVVITAGIPPSKTSPIHSAVVFYPIVGDASAELNAEDLDYSDFSFEAFVFTGTKPVLTAGVTYYLVLYGNFTVSATKYVEWSQATGYNDGLAYQINGTMTWSVIPGGRDFGFYIIGHKTTEEEISEYALANLDDYMNLRETAAQTLMAQSFIPIFDGDISKVKLYLSKVGSPTAHVWVEIHSSTDGTAGTKEGSTNIVGQASEEIDASSLDAFPAYGLQTFTFSGTKPTVVRDGTYYIVIYSDTPISATDFVRVGIDRDSPEADGEAFQIDGSYVWGELAGADLIYYLYRVGGDIIGEYSFAVTFVRGGNYPCESNPSPFSAPVTVAASSSIALSGIPVSLDPTVTARNIYRTEANMVTMKWLARIDDNTTTTYTSNEDDNALGDDLSFASERPPAGTTIEPWDGRLWVAGVPDYDEYLFPSGLDTPEQFDLTYNVPLREREAGKIKLIMEFADELWAFKAASIWKVARDASTYIVDKMVDDVGIGPVGSAVRCGKDMLIFLSNHKRIEVLTPSGLSKPEVPISAKVRDTLASINQAAINKCSAGNYIERGEYRLAVPTGANTEPDTVIIFNYLRGTFGLDTYNHYPTSIMTTDYILGVRATLYGSSIGSLYRVDEEAFTDDGVAIAWDVQLGWWCFPGRVKLWKTYLDYLLPASKAIAMRIYKDFGSSPAFSKTLTGNTPAGDDPSLRDTIRERLDMTPQGKAFSFRFINVDDATKVKISRINVVMIVREKGASAKSA